MFDTIQRQLVECVLRRCKIFGALGSAGKWHHTIEKHHVVFNVACNVVNVLLEREPVWQHINWYIQKMSTVTTSV